MTPTHMTVALTDDTQLSVRIRPISLLLWRVKRVLRLEAELDGESLTLWVPWRSVLAIAVAPEEEEND